MSALSVYQQVQDLLEPHLPVQVDSSSRERLALLVVGMLGAKSASPAQIAQALARLGLRQAQPESIERQIRRIENDPELSASFCVHPLAKAHLALGKQTQLVLLLDPTTQDERVVVLSACVWYRGRALPLCWAVWPANTKLTGEGFWQRVGALLEQVAALLPLHVRVIFLADRAFGCAAFTDRVAASGWHFLVRVQGQTRCQQRPGRLQAIGQLVKARGQRAKLRAPVFKKAGFRDASVVVYWGARHKQPLCLVSNLALGWHLVALYQKRYGIEASFRDYKSCGWQFEQGQVTDLAHLERLLVGMALATWIALLVGTQVASEWLAKRSLGRRRTRPYIGKFSLFTLGLQQIQQWLCGSRMPRLCWQLADWDAPNWQQQIYAHHARAYVLAWH